MLRLRAAVRIAPSSRWAVQQRPRVAFMATGLPGMSGDLLDEKPASTVERALPPHQPSVHSAGQIFANSFQERMNKDPELAQWDATRPPVGPSSAYPPPAPPTMSSDSAAMHKLRFRDLRHYGLYVKSSRNNTITTVTNPDGGQLKTYSGGICGFKGNRRASYEAGYQCAVKAIEFLQALKQKDPALKINLKLNGFGQGRDAMNKALISSEGYEVRRLVTQITDITSLKIGGTRAKKKRRA